MAMHDHVSHNLFGNKEWDLIYWSSGTNLSNTHSSGHIDLFMLTNWYIAFSMLG